MKKILIVVAIVLCLAVAGAALAVSYNSADDVTGALEADTYFKLDLGGSAETAITLNPGTPVKYTISCSVTKSSENVTNTGVLTISLADATQSSQDLDDVTVQLYSDENCTQAIDGKVAHGSAESIVIQNIDDDVTYYALISIPANLEEDDCNDCGGTMTLTFVKA